MLFSYNWLQSFFKKKLPKPEKLAELLTIHSFETTCQKSKVNGQESILDIDVLPNRASDCLSHFGVAREIAAITNSNLKSQITQPRELSTQLRELSKLSRAQDFIKVEVKDKKACPRYTARVITDVKVEPSPKWIEERLRVCGLRPINNIVDIVNYVMLETGQPIHAFDFDKISGIQNQKSKIKNQKHKLKIKNIIVRKAKKGEKIVSLDNEKYDLDNDVLVIADIKEPLAIAGIKGGKKAEITKSTKTVILESANFNPQIIRRGSRKLNLRTEASLRFEQGIDPNLTEFAINRAAYLIQKIARGKIAKGLIDIYPKKVLAKEISLDLDYVEKLLGVKIPVKEIKNILKRLGFKYKYNENRSRIIVGIPTFRLDINIPEDLIEEIGRIYGYEKIPAVFPVVSLIPAKKNLEIFWEDFSKNILKEIGFTEVYNYSFIGEKEVKIFGNKELIEIENPTSSDFQYLRPSLIPNLLKNVQKNQSFSFFRKGRGREIKLFELGKIFSKRQGEKRMLTGLITGDAFYQAKGVVDLLLNKLGISNIWYDDYQPTPEETKISLWQAKKCAEIKVDSSEIGFLGEISGKILDALKIENKVVVFDIDFEKLSKLASEEQEYRPISQYPAALRDIAVLVPRQVRVEEVLNKIETAAGNLLRDVDLFDIYEGEELPEGKKNLAFHLIYQAQDHTLSSKEIDDLQNKIIRALEREPDWQVRR